MKYRKSDFFPVFFNNAKTLDVTELLEWPTYNDKLKKNLHLLLK